MNELINRSFKVWAYTVSHSVLILRSPLRFPDQDNYDENYTYNIDIEFVAVAYMDIPVSFEGMSIKEIVEFEEIPEHLKYFVLDFGDKVFEIKSQENLYYIVAANFLVSKNKWIAKDRISNMFLKHDEIIEM